MSILDLLSSHYSNFDTVQAKAANCFVKQYPPSGISVLIVGAGTSGVFAALECWRKGHEVRIIERAPEPSQLGDAYSIGPSAIRAFKSYPGMLETNDRVSYDPWLVYHKHSGEKMTPPISVFAESKHSDVPARMYRHLRPRFQNMLLDHLEKIGVEIEWNKHVVEYFEDIESGKGGVVLNDDERIERDLVIAADGVGTKSYKIITETPTPAQSSGYSLYRTAFPLKYIESDDILTKRFPEWEDGKRVLETWTGPDMHGFVWRTDERMIWSITHRDTGTAEESWSTVVDKEDVLKFTATIPDWPEERTRLIKATPEGTITDFKLVWRDPQPQWVSPGGRVVQIGDAAHTFLPSSGNGATQGIEDAVSLASCLHIAGKNNIPIATKVHNLLRCERVNCAQLMGCVSQTNRHTMDWKAVNGDKDYLKKTRRYGRWIWSHDAEVYAYDNYGKALMHLTTGAPFQNTNIPPGYTCKPWTIEDVLNKRELGESLLGVGDWS